MLVMVQHLNTKDKHYVEQNKFKFLKIMSNKISIVLVLLFLLISCSENNDIFDKVGEEGYSYNKSLKTWNALKEVNNNSYVYKLSFVSWTGFGSSTELEIKDGEVVSRAYEEYRFNLQNGENEVLISYFETIDNLGEHSKGAIPQTIDDLYTTCAAEYLVVSEKDNRIYFETDEDGLMKMCGFVPNNCMDDCYIGVTIKSFKWTNK